jgi:hypothetical protein
MPWHAPPTSLHPPIRYPVLVLITILLLAHVKTLFYLKSSYYFLVQVTLALWPRQDDKAWMTWQYLKVQVGSGVSGESYLALAARLSAGGSSLWAGGVEVELALSPLRIHW